MSAFFENLVAEAQSYSAAEAVAVVTAVGYLLLAIRQNIWCWVCAGISTSIYVYLFIDARLYMESALNVFYFGMAVYGWSVWYRGRSDEGDKPVVVWPRRRHVYAIAAIAVLAVVNGLLLERHTAAAFPYVDSATTWGAIWATYLVAQKVLENWWYWLVIDAVSVALYWARDLELTALLFVVYLIMIPFGMISWRRSMRERAAA